MKVGITGSNGVLGSILVKKMLVRGDEIIPFDGDITNLEDIRKWLELSNFDTVLHLAAIVPSLEVQSKLLKAFAVNSVGTKNLIDILNEKSNKTWVFYASTSHVYKSSEKQISEDDNIEPISEYGLTKYAGEVLAKKYYSNLCIGRIFSMYHKTQKPPFLYANMKKRLKEDDLSKEFELYGAESERDFLNAEMVADIIIKLMDRKVIGTYNIASGKGIKIKDFVRGLTKRKLIIKDMGGKDILVANVGKLRKVLNEK